MDYTIMSSFNIINHIKKEYNGRNTIHLEIIGKEAGDMIACIYGDNSTKGISLVSWENFQYKESENALNEILNEAEKWDCNVFIINPKGEQEKLR